MTNITLTNTLTRQKEVFEPIDPQHVKMYACGPTVYDFVHLGNGRMVVVFDVLYRLLKRHYPRVTYVRNITDVDDKIMARSIESGESIESLTQRTTQAFHDDMAALNALPPDIEPRATAHIPQMIALCETLIAKGHAYVAEGHVLFNVPSMETYGALSRRNRDELVAGARVDVAPYKRDAADFVLWKPSTPEQVGWESPWGRGRPGWHIECSAMAKEYLGVTFDIHGGGLDLIFPHHENEIAQSCCAHDGQPLANVWLHNGFLTISGEKMSKSLGNFFTVRDLLKKYHGEVIRLVLLSAHYRQPLDFSDAALEEAKAQLDKWYRVLRRTSGEVETPIPDEVEQALCDDLNTPQAITEIHKIADKISPLIGGGDASQTSFAIGYSSAEGMTKPFPIIGDGFALLRSQLIAAGHAIGLLHQSPETWFKWQPEGAESMSDAEIDALIAARIEARKNKDFAEADRLRKELSDNKIVLEDSAGGTTWRRG